ncbi:hypothetical protein B0T24DRAFT_198553 [Lasiosphaeria ovina]|uniref:Mitochondrial outer membrane protein OM14 C-terminal domain-containing protein n=1 Tax=Lasiosphaeria ovina TaxID=92902 RepID=A0AAE0NFU4_9PEZI|nr:hypothetical protein B0T24DRAFT_198553 [Lasiosphaeria ovina]
MSSRVGDWVQSLPYLDAPTLEADNERPVVSYAEIASKGPKQTPEEAAAPQPPQIVHSESASTSSLIDVDTPSVRTVPSDFAEQEVKTETQAARIEREEKAAKEAAAAAKARAEGDLDRKKKSARAKAHKADNWLTKRFERISDGGAAGAVAAVNLFAVVGLSGFLGYRAWGLYDHGRLTWKHLGLGFGVLGVVGAFEGVVAGYMYKAKKNKGQ